jgi:fibronectin-binding autotransporter adhesin
MRLESDLANLGSITWSSNLYPAIYNGATGVTVGNGVSWGWVIKNAMVGTDSATFTNPAPTGAITTGVGTATFTWGSGDPSSLSFSGASFDTSPGKTFRLGTLTFHNGTIPEGTGADSVTFNISTNLTNVPEKDFTFSTDFTLVNTTNTDDPIASADYVSIGDFSYTFNVLEGDTASVDIFGQLSTDLSITSTGSSSDLKDFDGLFDADPDFVLTLVGLGTPGSGGFLGGGASNSLYWDGSAVANANNGVVDGGSGTWSATNPNWTSPVGAANGPYAPQPGPVVFSGNSGVVTVDDSAGAVAVTGMQFATDGYVIVGDAVTLSGEAAIIQVGDGTTAGSGYTATINSQLIGSAGLTKTDLGTLVLGAANTYTGATTISGGTLVGSAASFGSGPIFDDAALVVDQPTDASFAGAINGSGTFDKRGVGTLDLTGVSSLTGAMQVEAGRLQVDGSLANSTVNIQAGASLGGTGIVGGVDAKNGSTIRVGDSIGALLVMGDFAQEAGSTYQVKATSTGSSDTVEVAGDVSLAAGATLQLVKADTSSFALGQRYTVLSALGGLTGIYTLTGATHVSAFVDVVADYDSNDVYLDVVQIRSLASAGATPNEVAAAGGADTQKGLLFTALVYLPTIADARAAFDQISGEIHATAKSDGLEDTRFVRDAVFERVGAALEADGGSGAAWGLGFGSWAQQSGDGNAGALTRNIGGMLVGADVAGGAHWRLGLLGGYSQTDLSVAARASTATAEDYDFGAYGGAQLGGVSVDFGAAYTLSDIRTNRLAVFPGFADDLTGDYQAGVAQLFGEIGYRFIAGRAEVEPFADIAAISLHTDAIHERGGVAFLSAEANTAKLASTTLGLKGQESIQMERGFIAKIFAQAGWRHVERKCCAYLSPVVRWRQPVRRHGPADRQRRRLRGSRCSSPAREARRILVDLLRPGRKRRIGPGRQGQCNVALLTSGFHRRSSHSGFANALYANDSVIAEYTSVRRSRRRVRRASEPMTWVMNTTASSSFGSIQKAVEAAPPQWNSPTVPGSLVLATSMLTPQPMEKPTPL